MNPLTPMSDQERISLYNINEVSRRQVMRIKKKPLRTEFPVLWEFLGMHAAVS